MNSQQSLSRPSRYGIIEERSGSVIKKRRRFGAEHGGEGGVDGFATRDGFTNARRGRARRAENVSQSDERETTKRLKRFIQNPARKEGCDGDTGALLMESEERKEEAGIHEQITPMLLLLRRRRRRRK